MVMNQGHISLHLVYHWALSHTQILQILSEPAF